jgi:NAD+ kinase
MIEKVFILENKNIKGLAEEKTKIETFVKKCGKVVENSPENVDLIITMGGDGTFLKAVHLPVKTNPLVYGIKYGNVGFLTNSSLNIEKKLDEILKGNMNISPRMMLEIKVYNQEKKIYQNFCLNEFSISSKSIRLMDLEVKRDKEKILKVRADGLIISTPTGSTAHSLSAGGPVTEPEMETIIITPVCPHILSWRPVLLSPEKNLSLRISPSACLITDGQEKFDISEENILQIKTADRKVKIIIEEESFFEKLTSNFNWSK